VAPDKAAAIVAGKKTITEAKREMKEAEAENRRAENQAKIALVPPAEQVAEKLQAKESIVSTVPQVDGHGFNEQRFRRIRERRGFQVAVQAVAVFLALRAKIASHAQESSLGYDLTPFVFDGVGAPRHPLLALFPPVRLERRPDDGWHGFMLSRNVSKSCSVRNICRPRPRWQPSAITRPRKVRSAMCTGSRARQSLTE
jgi:hypothetical protein